MSLTCQFLREYLHLKVRCDTRCDLKMFSPNDTLYTHMTRNDLDQDLCRVDFKTPIALVSRLQRSGIV